MDNLGIDDKIIENINLIDMAAKGCIINVWKGFISSREIRGSALVEISGDPEDSRFRGNRRRKVYYLIPL